MSFSKFVISSVVAVGLLVPLAAVAAPAHRHDPGCALSAYSITQVVPYRVEERVGRGTLRRLAGAKLFVPAQPGMTKEWIGSNVRRHLREMGATSMAGCPLDVDKASVTVTSGTTGFWVQISSKNPKAAQEILARAAGLVR